MEQTIGFRWWGKTKDINSKEFKQASKDLLKLRGYYDLYLYLMSFSDLEEERIRVRNKLKTKNNE